MILHLGILCRRKSLLGVQSEIFPRNMVLTVQAINTFLVSISVSRILALTIYQFALSSAQDFARRAGKQPIGSNGLQLRAPADIHSLDLPHLRNGFLPPASPTVSYSAAADVTQ
jgi:hypothetical protein